MPRRWRRTRRRRRRRRSTPPSRCPPSRPPPEESEARRAAEVEQQEQELLEVRSIPLCNYLMQNVVPTLTEGLLELCKLKPTDPVDYLAEYLFKNNPAVEDPVD